MNYLKLKIPPVAVLLIFALLIYLTSKEFQFTLVNAVLSLAFVLFGFTVIFLGLIAFSQHKTTSNPLNPNQTKSIVSSGIYRFTRNPMYLGMSLLLMGFSILLMNIFGFAFVLGFVFYITYFQIIPEENILKEKFKQEFVDYCNAVRRWV